MAFKFRKRVKIAPGLTVNISKSGISSTVGVKGASINVGKKGAYLNTGIPGTGIYDRKKIGGGKSKGKQQQAAARNFAAEIEEAPADVQQAILSGKYFKSLSKATWLTAFFGCLGVGRYFSTEARWLMFIMWIIPLGAYLVGIVGGAGPVIFTGTVFFFNLMETLSVRKNIREYNAAVLAYLLDGGDPSQLETAAAEGETEKGYNKTLAIIFSTVLACTGAGYFYVKMWKSGVATLAFTMLFLTVSTPAEVYSSFTILMAPFEVYFVLREIKKSR